MKGCTLSTQQSCLLAAQQSQLLAVQLTRSGLLAGGLDPERSGYACNPYPRDPIKKEPGQVGNPNPNPDPDPDPDPARHRRRPAAAAASGGARAHAFTCGRA